MDGASPGWDRTPASAGWMCRARSARPRCAATGTPRRPATYACHRRRRSCSPAERSGSPVEALLDADARQRLAGRPLVAFAIDIAQAELQRIDPEVVGDQVDLRFDGEIRHRSGGRAERAGCALVGVDGKSFEG